MKRKPALFAPLLACVVFLLAGFSGPICNAVQSISSNAFLSVSVIQFLVFLLPVAFYCGIGRLSFFSMARFRRVPWKNTPFLIFVSLCFLFGAATIKYLSFAVFGTALSQTSSIVSAALYTNNAPLVLLCFVLIPAVLEEVLFRGVLFSEYGEYGFVIASLVTALMFSMAHFSFTNFLLYFFAGLVFGGITAYTGSIWPSVILHTLYNGMSLYLGNTFMTYLTQTGGSNVVFYFVCGLFLTFLVLSLSSLERSFSQRAKNLREGTRIALEEATAGRNKSPIRAMSASARFREVFLSPAFILLVALFLLYATGII